MKYWVYINNEILGPHEKEKLLELPAFTPSTLICPQTPIGEKTEDWKEASTYPEISAMLSPAGGAADKNTSAPMSAAQAPQPAAESAPVEPQTTARSQPVFNNEEPQIKFKSLSPSSIDQTPPRSIDLPAINIGITRLGPASSGRVNKEPAAETPVAPVSERTQTSGPVIPLTPINQTQENQPADANTLAGIVSRLDALTRSSLSGQELASLKEKLSRMEETLSSIQNNRAQNELMDKIKELETAVAAIKVSLAQNPGARSAAPAKSQALEIERNSDTVFGTHTQRSEALKPAEPKRADAAAPAEPVDQGSVAQTSGKGGVIKKMFRFLLTLILLAAVLGGAAFGLKYLGIFDAGQYIPLPFLKSPEQAIPAIQLSTEAASGTEAQNPPETQAEASTQPKKEMAPEIIYFARTYSLQPDGSTLENKIFEDAIARKCDFNRTNWLVSELPNGSYEATAVIPSLTGQGSISYRYEVDYSTKTIKALDAQSGAPLNSLIAEAKLAKKREATEPPPQPKKTRKAKTVISKPAPKKAAPAAKQAAAGGAQDEEYEYVYEDEEPAAGTEE